MRLNEVPTELLKESLLAIADLRRKYTGGHQMTKYASTHCPLCRFENTLWDEGFRDSEECSLCPWVWIEDHNCENFPQDPELDYSDFPIPDRLKRVDRWEAAINAEIVRREVV